ncbi:hypothetical protein PROFUN_01033 [Planoprotostelium fungivorum]|uniref:Uncharacterized protein n=1 Tax=Planoprotostelium fungivorum TaxID=1890364 RepID=A0A2P6N4G9_9EUKA|nr:hypothetical protein PROFUN_01033 [Planoprotostelium fungivorum]
MQCKLSSSETCFVPEHSLNDLDPSVCFLEASDHGMIISTLIGDEDSSVHYSTILQLTTVIRG